MRLARNLPVLRQQPQPPTDLQGALIPQNYAHPGLSLTQIFSILRAYQRKSLIVAAVVLALAAVVIKLLPRTYTATATLMMNYQVNDPLGGKEFPIGLLGSYMSTQMEIMQSAEVLFAVVDSLHLTQDREFTAGFNGKPEQLRDWVKDKLIKNLTIEQGKYGGQLIYLTAASREPDKAAKIANTLAEVYLSQQLRRVTDPAADRGEGYSKQVADLKNKVTAAQDRVTAFRQRTGVTELQASNTDIDQALLTTLEQRLQEAQNQRRAAEVKQRGDQSVSAPVIGSNLVQGLKTQLAQQQSQLAQARTTLGPNHPRIIELQSQIQATQNSINAEIRTFAHGSASELEAARQLEQKMAAAVAEQRSKLLAVRKYQDEGSRLLVELESAQSVYKRALEGYDQIMAAAGGKYSNVNFVSRAQVPLEPTRPKTLKLLLVGVLAAVLCGLLGPLGYELILNRRVRCRDDLERDLGIPVLAEFAAVPALEVHS
ncbi:MAG TPA: Wzz/FepE/Etk N-terminal domain-containing protein [Steroidobacteraceae bacterium]|nr:Wzz/FepE/Etk N-terminal domain-containing protein [Steroidobacteraceae bacterium]